MLSFSQRKTVRNALAFLHSFLERCWKESKYPTRFSFTWSPTVCRIDQSTPRSDRCAPLYIETNTADRIGILICIRRTTVFRSGEQPTWKFPSVAQANFFLPRFSPATIVPIRYQNVPSNIFFRILRRSRFSFFFHKNRKFFYTSGSRGDQDPQKKSSAVSSWEIRYRNYFQKFIFITSIDCWKYCPRDRENLEESIIDLTNWTMHRNGGIVL